MLSRTILSGIVFSCFGGGAAVAWNADTVLLAPNQINMVVGETRTISALNESGQQVAGLTWASSNSSIVSLSNADPPIITAVTAGHVTISAGTATADVTVWATALPTGTVQWSSSGTGGGFYAVVPAVPSPNGVADAFAFQNDGTVQAVTSDGATTWTADLNLVWGAVPDFEGGLVGVLYGDNEESVVKYSGTSGTPTTMLTIGTPNHLESQLGVHTDGTIFVIVGTYDGYVGASVVGIDSATGMQKFTVPVGDVYNEDLTRSMGSGVAGGSHIIIAGDGYAYVPYAYQVGPAPCHDYLRLLRIDSSGSYTDLPITDWANGCSEMYGVGVEMITNGDSGILLSWNADQYYSPYGTLHGMALINGASVSLIGAPGVPNQTFFSPSLQTGAGWFVGSATDASENSFMVAFDSAGTVHWSVSGYYNPQIATPDGGVIATSYDDGTISVFSPSGTITEQLTSLPTHSWTGIQYQVTADSLQSVVEPLRLPNGSSYWASLGGNPSGNGTAIPMCPCLLGETSASSAVESAAGSQKRYLVMAGDPGLNLGDGRNHNVGRLFNLAAQTEVNNLRQSADNAVITTRVSSFADVSVALTGNGTIDGGVVFFGHGGIDAHGNWALFPGELPGDANNVTRLNVGQLSNVNLGADITITLNACHSGAGGTRSIAQLLANQLRRTVLAYPVGMHFGSSPTFTRFQPRATVPSSVPVYMIPDDGRMAARFSPQ